MNPSSASADIEYLYDRPYVDPTKVRVTGPFTVESLSPHRVVPSGDDEVAEELKALTGKRRSTRLATPPADFTAMVLEHLRTAGVHQVEKCNTIKFDQITGRATSAANISEPRPSTSKVASNVAPPF